MKHSKKTEDTATVSLMLRLPAELHQQLKDAAVMEERSLNTQIVRLLQTVLTSQTARPTSWTRPVDYVWRGPGGLYYVMKVQAIEMEGV